MTDDIPQWALQRAAQLVKQEYGADYYHTGDITGTYGVKALARYIVKHEGQPVDPLLIEARETAAKFFEEYGNPIASGNLRAGKLDSAPIARVALEALRRGIELGKAGAA